MYQILETFTLYNSEDDLIQLLKNRNVHAVSLLYDKYSAALFNVILRVVQAKEIAEEVLQDTFTKAWRNIDTYDATKGRFYTWLINIARNSAIDATRIKNYKRQNERLDNLTSRMEMQLSTSFNPDIINVKKLTEILPPDHKILIDLIYFEGFTQAEAAEWLSIPIGTIKTRLRVAITLLRALFGS
jgi:RNA polymerase sigma-70 factor, ECF subfamily